MASWESFYGGGREGEERVYQVKNHSSGRVYGVRHLDGAPKNHLNKK